METESNYPSLANHLRRIIPALIIANIIQPLQIWLGIEYSHLSKELKRGGGKQGEEALGRVAGYFLGAGILTLFSFALWLIPYILPFLPSITMYLSGHSIYIPGLGYTMSYDALFQYASLALPAIMGMIQTVLLYKAWKQIRVFFSKKDQQQTYRSGGVVGAGRVIWAMDLSAAGYAFTVLGFILFAVAIYLNEMTTMGPMLVGLGYMLSFAGWINQGIGIAQTARGFQNLIRTAMPAQGYPAPQPQYQQPIYQPGIPQTVFAPAPAPPQIQNPTPQAAEPPRARFCTGCGAELPVTPGLKFCPTCGSKI